MIEKEIIEILKKIILNPDSNILDCFENYYNHKHSKIMSNRYFSKIAKAIMAKIKEEERKNIKYVSGNDGYIGSISLSKKGKL